MRSYKEVREQLLQQIDAAIQKIDTKRDAAKKDTADSTPDASVAGSVEAVDKGTVAVMDDPETEIDETGRNPTQRQMDEEGTDDKPVDVDWEDIDSDA